MSRVRKGLLAILGALSSASNQANAEDLTIYALIQSIIRSETQNELLIELPRYGFVLNNGEAGTSFYTSQDVGANITFTSSPMLAYAVFLQPDAATAKMRAEGIVADLLPNAVTTVREETGENWANQAESPTVQVFWELQDDASLPVLGIVKNFGQN